LAVCFVLAAVDAFAQGQPKDVGEWSTPIINWPNVGIHMHVLPDGKVLFWGRREWKANQNEPVDGPDGELDTQECTPRIWDPAHPNDPPVDAPSPLLRDGPERVNLFCAGHTFLPDSRLLVVGGHISDGHGSNKVRIFDSATGWHKGPPMGPPFKGGRWYPTAVALPNGSVAVLSGGNQEGKTNIEVQVFTNGTWDTLKNASFDMIPLYPWLHVAPDGRVFMSGPSKDRKTQFLNTTGEGEWEVVDTFNGRDRDYGTAVMYDVGKVLIIGGGMPPQRSAEMIDLNQRSPKWKDAGNMAVGRRHHNATILPDGTVFVNGGTSKSGPPHPFNDLSGPVLQAELWIPPTATSDAKFIPMAAEDEPRLYHSTSVLLPDGRVLSAGGGEYRIDTLPGKPENDPDDTHRNAQIYSPPYLFKSTPATPRPDITAAPDIVTYGAEFEVGTSRPEQVGQVNLVALSSVTHAFNQSQRINFLSFKLDGGKLKVRAPENANQCPPGHYMLFVLNKDKVPSVARIVRVH